MKKPITPKTTPEGYVASGSSPPSEVKSDLPLREELNTGIRDAASAPSISILIAQTPVGYTASGSSPPYRTKSRQQTPAQITDQIRAAFTGELIYLEVTPRPDSLPLRCYDNVASAIRDHGGSIVYGWMIWEGGDQSYLKLAHHAVWRRLDGSLADITPTDDRRNLFLADSESRPGAEARYISLDGTSETVEFIEYAQFLDAAQTAILRRLAQAVNKSTKKSGRRDTRGQRAPRCKGK